MHPTEYGKQVLADGAVDHQGWEHEQTFPLFSLMCDISFWF